MYRIGQEEIDAVANVIKNGRMFRTLDPNAPVHELLDFERDMRAYLNVENYFLLTSGKGALICALIACGVGPGDEVIVPAYTYVATALTVLAVGAIPVVVDIDSTLGLDPKAVEAAMTPNVKAIIPVHMQGMPANMEAICDIAKKHGCYVIEDACQAVGGSFKGKKLGTWGDCGAYSYNYFKNISAGEGGGLTTKTREMYERAYIYHDSSGVPYFGKNISNLDDILFAGSEFRANEITAAILRVQLTRLDGIMADLRKNRDYVWNGIKDIPGIKLSPSNDYAGDVGNNLTLIFDEVKDAEKFASLTGSGRAINTGKHVAWSWGILFRHRGAAHEKMNPFNFEANRGLRMDYAPDMCAQSHFELSRHPYFPIDINWTEAEMDALIKKIKDAAAQL